MDKRLWILAAILCFLVSPAQMMIGPTEGIEPSIPASYRTHITIDGDSGFNASNGVIRGSGTVGDPYVIENLSFDCSQGKGILIEKTTKCVLINNCTFENGSTGGGYGISIRSVKNCRIENCSFINNSFGVSLKVSTSITIKNNEFVNESFMAVDIEFQNSIIGVINNSFSECANAVYGYNPKELTINGNMIVGGESGIYLTNDPQDVSIGSNAISNTPYPLTIYEGEGISIYGNMMNDSIRSISLASDTTAILTNNTIMNSVEGLFFSSGTLYSNAFVNSSVVMDQNPYNVIMPDNNSVNGKKIKFVSSIERYDSFDENDVGEYIFHNVENILIENLTMKDVGHSMFIIRSRYVVIRNSTFQDIYAGPQFHRVVFVTMINSSMDRANMGFSCMGYGRVILKNNTFNGYGDEFVEGSSGNVSGMGQYGFSFKDCTVFMDNNIVSNALTGVLIDPYSIHMEHNMFKKCGKGMVASVQNAFIANSSFVDNYGDGMRIAGDGEFHILGSNCSGNDGDGMNLSIRPEFDIIGNDICNNSGDGLFISGGSSVGSNISMNRMSDNGRAGISINGTYRISNNTIDRNILCGMLLLASYSVIEGNSISGSPVGIQTNASYCEFSHNIVFANGIGINMSFAFDNVLYDNLISNTLNVRGNSIDYNYWNISKRNSVNILGNGYISGNHWSDYSGGDRDGDGIGDTMLPHGPGDMAPIVVIPEDIWIEDRTLDNARTGMPHMISSRIFNSSADSLAYYHLIVDHYGQGAVIRTEHFNGTKMNPNKYINHSIKVSDEARSLAYYIKVRDVYGNIAQINGLLTVEDVLPPEVVRSTLTLLKTGEDAVLELVIDENIELVGIDMRCEFNDTNRTVVHLQGVEKSVEEGVRWCFDFRVPETARSARIDVDMVDSANLGATFSQPFIPIADVIGPVIIDENTGPVWEQNSTSLVFHISDNIELDHSYIDIEYGFEGSREKRVLVGGNGLYEIPIYVPFGASTLNYTVQSFDPSGNHNAVIGSLPVISKGIVNVEDLSYGLPETGRPFFIHLSITPFSDNVTYESFYRFDQGEEFYFKRQSSIVINKVPEDSRILRYGIIASDNYGRNEYHDFEKLVRDVTLPSLSLTHLDPETGEVLVVDMEATDNRGLEGSILRYDVGKGWMLPNETVEGTFEVSVPSTCRLLILNASAWDEEGNTLYVESVLHVSDILFPMIGAWDHTIVYDGRYAIVSLWVDIRDNVGITRAWIEWSSQDLNRATDMIRNGSFYEGKLWADRGPGYVRLSIMATDAKGNIASGGTETIPLQMEPEARGGGSSWAFTIVLFMICATLAGIAIYTYLGLRRESARRPIEIAVEE